MIFRFLRKENLVLSFLLFKGKSFQSFAPTKEIQNVPCVVLHLASRSTELSLPLVVYAWFITSKYSSNVCGKCPFCKSNTNVETESSNNLYISNTLRSTNNDFELVLSGEKVIARMAIFCARKMQFKWLL